jgi:ATP-dependent RNA helicase DDX56/DBP9
MATSESFAGMGLDPRVLTAITRLGYQRPTQVQATSIPLALQGKDVLARARTGSGKTVAYCVPVVQKILHTKASIKDVRCR